MSECEKNVLLRVSSYSYVYTTLHKSKYLVFLTIYKNAEYKGKRKYNEIEHLLIKIIFSKKNYLNACTNK